MKKTNTISKYETSKGIFRPSSLKNLLKSKNRKLLYYYNMTRGNAAMIKRPHELFDKFGGIPLIIRQRKLVNQEIQEHEYHLSSFWVIKEDRLN